MKQEVYYDTGKGIINVLSVLLILLVNSLWIIRYSHRISASLPVGLTIVYIVLSLTVIILAGKVRWLRSNAMLMAVLFCYSVISFVIIAHTDLSEISLDRSRIIARFWDSVFSGYQPYSMPADNGNYPGPLPFYFVLMLPVYMVKAYWLPAYISGLIMLWLYYKHTGGMSRQSMALFFMSPFLYYEILTGSNILFNSVLMLLWFLWIKDKKLATTKELLVTAVITGLLLCVRQVFVMAVVIYVMSLLRDVRLVRILEWGCIVILVWCLCFLPIVCVYGIDSFISYNPFNVQNDIIFPFKYSVIFIGIAAIWGLFVNTEETMALSMGVSLMLIPATILVYHLANGQTIFDTNADITYTLFGTSFLFYVIHNNSISNKWSKGKKL